MRRFLAIVAIVLGVLVVAAIVVPFLIPMESYRATIADAATRATGRDVQIDGDLRLTVYPELGVSVQSVTVANTEGARDPVMLSIGNLVIGVRLMPLFSGRVEVAELVLERPVIHLEVAADGTPNWDFATEAPQQEQAPADSGGGMGFSEFGIEELRISDGEVSYYDTGDGTDLALSDVDVALAMPSADAPLSFDGGLTYNAERLEIDAEVERPRDFLADSGTPTRLSLASNLFDAGFAGTLALSGHTTGDVTLDIPSLRGLAAYAGSPLPEGDNLGATTIEAALANDGNLASLQRLRMTLDGMTITGELTLDRSNAVLLLGGGLAIDRLDLNTYLVSGGEGAGDGAASGDTPLELGILKAVNADLTLSVGELLFQNLTFERAALGARLNSGLLNAELRELSLYGGSGRGTLVIDAREATPSFRHTLNVSGTQADPLLTALMEVDRITGAGTLNLDLSARGTTVNQIVGALSGTADLNFADGALRGVDLAAVSRLLQTAVNQGGLGSVTGNQASTEFTELGGSFRIQNGVAHNDDLRLVNPVLSVLGNGQIDLNRQTLDFRLEPRPAAAGNVGGFDLTDVGVPFRVHGPWTNLSYTPDVRGVVTGVMEGILGGVLGGQQEAEPAGQEGAPEGEAAPAQENPLANPEEALRSLFGIGGR